MPQSAQNLAKVAIMFTDIKGYSALMHHDEAGTIVFLKEHGALLRKVIKRQQGRVIKTIGDAFMVEFKSAARAVTCAIGIQRLMTSRNKKLAELEGRNLRIGIHLGVVTHHKRDALGDVVNIAARLEALSSSNGILVSEAVRTEVKAHPEVHFIPAGLRKLKNIDTPVSTFQVYAPRMHPAAKQSTYISPAKKISWLSAAAAVLLALYLALRPSYRAWAEELRWKPLTAALLSGPEAGREGWTLTKIVGENGPKQVLSLNRSIPGQPFRIRAWVTRRGQEHAEICAQFIVPQAKTRSKDGALPMEGLLSQDHFGHQINEDINWGKNSWQITYENEVKKGLGLGTKRLKLFDGKLTQQPEKIQVTFTFDGDVFSYQGLGGSTQRFVKFNQSSAKFNDYWPEFSWSGIQLERLEISVLNKDPNLQIINAAKQYEAGGQYELALGLYDELGSSTRRDPDRCRYLYCKAATLASMGRSEEAEHTYFSISDRYPSDLFAAYALSEAIGMEFSRVQRLPASECGSLLQDIQTNTALFTKLYPGHPRSSEIENVLLAMQTSYLGDFKEILRLVKAGVGRDAYEYQSNAIWSVAQVIAGNSAVPSGTDCRELVAWFEAEIKKGSFQGSNLGYAIQQLMQVYADQNQWGRALGLALYFNQSSVKSSVPGTQWDAAIYAELAYHPLSPKYERALARLEKDEAQAAQLYKDILGHKAGSDPNEKIFRSRLSYFLADAR